METYDNALVSVIVPVFKVERYIQRCLDSICNQTYRNLEIILIDDGSPDRSGEICDEYARKDKRIKVIHKQNAGVSAARNDGLDIATGDFITFVDSDDYIAPEMYQTLVKLIIDKKVDIAICNFAKENKYGVFEPYWKEDLQCIFSQQEQLKYLLTNRYYCCSCCEMLFKKKYLTDIRFDIMKKHNEDLLFIYEVMKKAQKSVYSSKALYFYCNNQDSAANSNFNDSKMSIIEVSEYINQDVQQEFPELAKIEKREYMRNNITCAMEMVRSSYKNENAIYRVRNNITRGLGSYVFSNASFGYKILAVLISLNWNVFKKYVRIRER